MAYLVPGSCFSILVLADYCVPCTYHRSGSSQQQQQTQLVFYNFVLAFSYKKKRDVTYSNNLPLHNSSMPICASYQRGSWSLCGIFFLVNCWTWKLSLVTIASSWQIGRVQTRKTKQKKQQLTTEQALVFWEGKEEGDQTHQIPETRKLEEKN